MTVADYNPFVERMIFRYEGNYGWNRNDPGGPTKFGITCYDLAEHRHEHMDSMDHWAPIVRAMTIGEADQIYADKYATACRFNDLNPGKDCVVFDYGVNSGPLRSIKAVQHLVNVAADGVLGPITLAAINAYDPVGFIVDLCTARLAFLQRLATWSVFGIGWANRVRDLRAYSLALVRPPKPMFKHEKKLQRIPMAFAKGWQ